MTKSVLIFRTGQLGDTLVAMPAIQEIRRKFPDHHLILLTDVHKSSTSDITSWDVLEPTGWFNDVIQYQPAENIVKKLSAFYSIVKSIRKYSPELVYDLVFPRSHALRIRHLLFLKWIAGIPRYRGYAESKKPLRNPNGTLPRVEPEWKRLLRVAGVTDQETAYQLPIPQSAQITAANTLKARGILKESCFVGFGPGSKISTKKWSEENFVALAKQILQENNKAAILILGGKDDAEIGQRLHQRLGERIHNLAGELSVYESAAVLKYCAAYIGNDTGTLHLAAMVGIPCVALFGARDYPGWWEPYGKDHIVIRKETDCAGCMLKVCDVYKNKCLNMITVAEVFDAVTKIVNTHMAHEEP